ncbi:hypothetical protein [Natronospora cellulosivora (SeqCode)]
MSKYTGVSRTTINNHPEIIDLINEQKAVSIEYLDIDIKKIYNLNHALILLEEALNQNRDIIELKNKYEKNFHHHMHSLMACM